VPLKFAVAKRKTSFLDPFNKFVPKTLEVEVRTDPLTGHVARVLHWRARPLGPIDHSGFLETSAQMKCPFCPENALKMCARFLPEDVPEGRLTRGETFCIPNAFPYETMNAVVVLGKKHYRTPAQFTPELLADGLLLARDAFMKLGKDMSFASVNWNYMMPAGGGLVHPHFQVAAGKQPTHFQKGLLAKAKAFQRREGVDIASAYVDAERQAKKRWLGRLGPAGWCVTYAPRAIYDLMALVPGNKGLMDLKPPQVLKLASGVARVLKYFDAKGVDSYNMALHTGLKPGSGLPLMLRLVSRLTLPPFGMDEINYFEKLHDEMLTFVPPEDVATELREYWC
jgi:galactose-1-phosphate uridylyltransferase